MLSDHERRVLEQLERWYAIDAPEPARSRRATRRSARRSSRLPGCRTVLLLTVVSVGLLFANVPVAGLAVALATAIGWVFWRLWAHRRTDGSMPAPPAAVGGTSISRYLRWLAEAER